jgi:hypothetical protein
MLLPFIFKQVTLVDDWPFPITFLITFQVVLVLLLEAPTILFKYVSANACIALCSHLHDISLHFHICFLVNIDMFIDVAPIL